MTDWSTIVLTGGQSTRLGQDKASALLDGRTLLDFVLASLPADIPYVIADRRGGGPVTGIVDGLALTTTPIVAILAVDMPFAAELIAEMVAGLDALGVEFDAVIPVDLEGRQQPLAAVYRTERLRAAIATLPDPNGASVRAAIASLDVMTMHLGVDRSEAVFDIDTPEDLEAARRTVSVDPEGKSR